MYNIQIRLNSKKKEIDLVHSETETKNIICFPGYGFGYW